MLPMFWTNNSTKQILDSIQKPLWEEGPQCVQCDCGNVIQDEAIQLICDSEQDHQEYGLELIASENYISDSVMSALSNVFSNRYSEGYPGKKWYGWQKHCEHLERVAQYRALCMFGLLDYDEKNDLAQNEEILKQQLKESKWKCNVQPHSWSPANAAIMLGLLKNNDTILGMSLAEGGHLSHGFPSNVSGVNYNTTFYGVTSEGLIDYEDMRQKLLDNDVKLLILGYSAYTRDIDYKKVRDMVDEINAQKGTKTLILADISHIAGLIVAKEFNSPFEHVDIVSTTTHKTLRWPRGAIILSNSEITVEHNNKSVSISQRIDNGVFPGVQGGPHLHTIVAKAVAFKEALSPDYVTYIKNVKANTKSLAQHLMNNGWKLMTDGTDNHQILIDVTQCNGKPTHIDGKLAQYILELTGLSVNKNSLPGDTNPFKPSGIRIGTPAITSRGIVGSRAMKMIAELMTDVLTRKRTKEEIENGTIDEKYMEQMKNKIVKNICVMFPLYDK